MGRALEFVFKGQTFKGALDKVDRAALYGSVDVETRDRSGRPCSVATLASDGRTLIASGGTAMSTLSADGRWLERSELVAVDERGNRLNSAGSSFDSPIELEATTSPERLLDHAIRLTYAVSPIDPVPAALARDLESGAIFKLDFSYRGGVRADPAFLMKGSEGALWLLVGSECVLDFVGLAEASGLAETAEPAGPEADDLDFEMM